LNQLALSRKELQHKDKKLEEAKDQLAKSETQEKTEAKTQEIQRAAE